jgi:hypothetical protein
MLLNLRLIKIYLLLDSFNSTHNNVDENVNIVQVHESIVFKMLTYYY